MKITKAAIIVNILISGASLSTAAQAKDNFNQSLIEYNNTSSYITDKSINTWALSRDVNAYPLVNGQPDYEHPVTVSKFTSGTVQKRLDKGAIVQFADQSQPLFIDNLNQNVYSYHALNVSKNKYKKLLRIEKKWQKTLSKKQVKAIGNYTNDGYSKINSHLRFPDQKTSKKVINETNLVNSAIAKFKTPFAMTIYRGIDEKGLTASLGNNSPAVGRLYQDAAFSSSSISHKIATGFQSSIVLRINLPAGYNGAYVAPVSTNSPEKEFLMKPNAKFVITKIQNVTTYYSMHGQIGNAKKHKNIQTQPTKIKYRMITMNLVE
ncbi:ADP-ribosyltransferase [Lactobacillaceae bacterium Melli_B4]